MTTPRDVAREVLTRLSEWHAHAAEGDLAAWVLWYRDHHYPVDDRRDNLSVESERAMREDLYPEIGYFEDL